MCLPEKIATRIKSSETMENAWIRLDAWFGDKSLFIKDLMQDVKSVTPIKDGDDERLMDYYVMLQAHIAEARCGLPGHVAYSGQHGSMASMVVRRLTTTSCMAHSWKAT
jgi:hypothetical protein